MSQLEEKIRALAARGELNYLSMIPVAGGFNAQVTPASRFGNSQAFNADPVKALLDAIEGLPKSFAKPPSKGLKEFGDPSAPMPVREAKTVGEVAAVQNGDPMPPAEEREPWDTL